MSFQPCRRQFLAVGAGITAATVLGACSGTPETLDEGTVLADVEDVPQGEAISVLIGDTPIILSHTPDGSFRAFSGICTHQGCKVVPDEEVAEILECPCHRSEFNTYTGEVLKGPADEDLPEYDVEVKDGKIIAT